jgi:hypothetical protein
VVPDEKTIPTRYLGRHRQIGHPIDIGQAVKGREKESVLHMTTRLRRWRDSYLLEIIHVGPKTSTIPRSKHFDGPLIERITVFVRD